MEISCLQSSCRHSRTVVYKQLAEKATAQTNVIRFSKEAEIIDLSAYTYARRLDRLAGMRAAEASCRPSSGERVPV